MYIIKNINLFMLILRLSILKPKHDILKKVIQLQHNGNNKNNRWL